MPNSHYENFPVASPLLPSSLRAPVRVIYAFARSADDLADEGDATPAERIAALNGYCAELDRIDAGVMPEAALFVALRDTLLERQLSTQPLRDLLSAFSQDVTKTRYDSFDELRDYCRRSADPVGRIMLALFGEQRSESLVQSDAICSGLQLINFLQDVAIDWQKARIYLPLEDLRRFGVDEAQIADGVSDQRWRDLMQFEVNRARQMMIAGAPLARRLPGRMGWELRLIVMGGLRILEKIEAVDHDVFHHRPILDRSDWLRLCWRSLRFVV